MRACQDIAAILYAPSAQLSRTDDPRKMKPDICAAMEARSGRASEGKKGLIEY